MTGRLPHTCAHPVTCFDSIPLSQTYPPHLTFMKIALIYNFAQHYRTNIFKLMDRSMDIDFYFGDKYLNVRKMDYGHLSNKVTELHNAHLGPLTWQKGAWRTLFRGYDTFIMLGEPMILTSWIILIMGRLMGKRVYFWTHGWYGRETKIKTIIKKAYFGLANGTLLYGNYAKDIMTSHGMKAGKITVIHNSLMYDEQINVRQTLQKTSIYEDHFMDNLPTILFVGRLTPEKQLNLIFEAQHICSQKGRPFNVVLVGDGTERETLMEQARQKHLEAHVWFYGPSYNEEELSNLIYNADICVSPGNIGLTAMHAMTYGCPCITHNDFPWQMPEFEAIKTHLTGDFFERGSADSLAECIERWLSDHHNDRESIRLACMKEIDEEWNPHRQLSIIKDAISH